MSDRLMQFVAGVARLAESGPHDESTWLSEAGRLMQALVAVDDWLPPAMAASLPQYYQQHLLYGDPLERFSLVSFVWGPGQQTPVHDHTVWGVIGVLRGAEYSQAYVRDPQGGIHPHGEEKLLQPGQVEMVSPNIGDIHRVRNAYTDRVSISIHLYGGNIGRIRRHVYTVPDGEVKPFVSGYSNALAPNLWATEAAA